MRINSQSVRKFFSNIYIAYGLALAGVIIYLVLSLHYANTQRSTIDEGLYLYKGYLFASGKYSLFQEYGPRTQYGPLSYLIPGFVQIWFGPGLRTGRIFAVILGVLAVFGLWIVSRRLSGPWWAAAAVWAVALSPAIIRAYSFGVSQGLVACMLMWILVLSTGKNRPIWQTSLSAVLAGFLLLTRQNMAPVLPILIGYIFWQHGKKQGWAAAVCGVLVVLSVHLTFWPGILTMWTPWLPAKLTPFLDAWRLPVDARPVLEFQPIWLAQLYSLLEGFRFHFTSLAGSIFVLLLWPARKAWKSQEQFRAVVFLCVLYFVLLVFHAWAGLGFGEGNNFNAFTFNPYLSFFTLLGLLLITVVFPVVEKQPSLVRQFLVVMFILTISTGIGYGGYEVIGRILQNISVPRILSFFRTGRILPGEVPLWDFLLNKFDISYEVSRWLLPTLAGILCGFLVLFIGLLIWSRLRRKKVAPFYSWGTIISIAFLLMGTVLSPSLALGGGFIQWECTGNVITTYEQAGEYLAGFIPPGNRVYWDGGNALAVLLYVPGIEVYPQQLDWRWNYWNSSDSDTLARFGYWNNELAQQWLQDADVLIIQETYNDSVVQIAPDISQFGAIGTTRQGMNCTSDSYLSIFRRSQTFLK